MKEEIERADPMRWSKTVEEHPGVRVSAVEGHESFLGIGAFFAIGGGRRPVSFSLASMLFEVGYS